MSNMDKLNIGSIIERVKAQTPPFWRKVRALMIVCGTIGGGITVLPAAQVEWLPIDTGGILVVIGIVGTSLSSLTASVPELDKNN